MMILTRHTSTKIKANRNLLCEFYIDHLYHTIFWNKNHDCLHGDAAETYGELFSCSITKIINYCAFSANDYFLDLGSGLGKFVIQAFLQTKVKRSCGIEIVPGLYHKSQRALEKFKEELPDFFKEERDLQFYLGNFLTFPFPQATILYLGSPCFGKKLLVELEPLIENIETLHTLITLRPFIHLKRFSFVKALKVQGTWDSALCYIYEDKHLKRARYQNSSRR